MSLNDIQPYVVDSLHESSSSVLMLDYDGTLAPFRAEREDAFPYPGIPAILDTIMDRSRSRLVIVSGRVIDDLIPLVGLRKPPEIWGSHGWERRLMDGSYLLLPADDEQLEGLADATALIQRKNLGRYSEKKPRSIAFHWRGLQLENREAMGKLIDEEIKPIADLRRLELKRFDGGIELGLPGRNKGDVVRTIVSESSAGCFCAYLGDDHTDEDAFEAIADHGLGVLVRREYRPTKARAHLMPPEELIEFLELWAESARRGG